MALRCMSFSKGFSLEPTTRLGLVLLPHFESLTDRGTSQNLFFLTSDNQREDEKKRLERRRGGIRVKLLLQSWFIDARPIDLRVLFLFSSQGSIYCY